MQGCTILLFKAIWNLDSIVLSTRQGNEPGKSCQGTIPWILNVQSKFLNGLFFEYKEEHFFNFFLLKTWMLKGQNYYCSQV